MTWAEPVTLRWTGQGLSFRGAGASGTEIPVDGDNEEGPSPTETLLLSLAGCMAIDLKVILEKSRVSVDELEATVQGRRAEEPPRRFTTVRLRFELTGPSEEDRDKVQRALHLSRDKYCSVLHTLRADLDLEMETEIRI